MKREANKMLKQAGMVYLSQAMIDLAESLNPTRSSDKKKVSKMIKDLEDILPENRYFYHDYCKDRLEGLGILPRSDGDFIYA